MRGAGGSAAVTNPTARMEPRTSRALVAWIQRRKFAEDTASAVHIETESGSGRLLCGLRVPGDDDRTSGGLYRGAEAIDAVDPFWVSCSLCSDAANGRR